MKQLLLFVLILLSVCSAPGQIYLNRFTTNQEPIGVVIDGSIITNINQTNVVGLTNALAGKANSNGGPITNLFVEGALEVSDEVILGYAAPERVLVTDSDGRIVTGTPTTTEVGYLSGVTSALQTQLNARVLEDSGVATNLTLFEQATVDSSGALVISSFTDTPMVLVSGTEKQIEQSATISSAELDFLNNVSGNIQTNFDARIPTVNGLATNSLTVKGNLGVATNLTVTNFGYFQTNIYAGGSITATNLTASRALVSDASKQVTNSTVTSTELLNVGGSTGNFQTNINRRVPDLGGTATNLIIAGASFVESDATLTFNAFGGDLVVVSTGSGALTESAVQADTLAYLDVTSSLQGLLNNKLPTTNGIATNSFRVKGTLTVDTNATVNSNLFVGGWVTATNLTASRALVSDANKQITNSATTSTELGYVSGVTSAIQTQLNAKTGNNSGVSTNLGLYGLTTIKSSGGIYFDDWNGGYVLVSKDNEIHETLVSSNALGYIASLSSDAQTQLNNRLPTTNGIATNGFTVKGNLSVISNAFLNSAIITNVSTNLANNYQWQTNFAAYGEVTNIFYVGDITKGIMPLISFQSAKTNTTIGRITSTGLNTSSNAIQFAQLLFTIDNSNPGTESGAFEVNTYINGSLATGLLRVQTNGTKFSSNVFVGGTNMVSHLHVSNSVIIPTGAVNGYVLTTDANGVATWQVAPSQANYDHRVFATNAESKITLTNQITHDISTNYTITTNNHFLSLVANTQLITLPANAWEGFDLYLTVVDTTGGTLTVTNTVGNVVFYALNDSSFEMNGGGGIESILLVRRSTNWVGYFPTIRP